MYGFVQAVKTSINISSASTSMALSGRTQEIKCRNGKANQLCGSLSWEHSYVTSICGVCVLSGSDGIRVHKKSIGVIIGPNFLSVSCSTCSQVSACILI